MAQYRFLQDCYLAGQYFNAGDVATLPNTVIPPAAVDPLDNAAITAFWNAGPQLCGLIRPQWSVQAVGPAAIYWVPFNLALTQYQLTGAGAALGPKCAGALLGNNP
jgi:hypothetical protein